MSHFRIAKSFEVEYGHRLCKHPAKCRSPHGHRLRIEVVARGRQLDGNDMVCDYAVLKALVVDLVQRLDHAMAVSSEDPQLAAIQALGERLVLFERQDPTTEVLARWLFEEIAARLVAGREVQINGAVYRVPPGLELERVRVWETSTSWAEYVGLE